MSAVRAAHTEGGGDMFWEGEFLSLKNVAGFAPETLRGLGLWT